MKRMVSLCTARNRPDRPLCEAMADRLTREAHPVVDAAEAPLLGRRDDLAIADEAGGRIAVERIFAWDVDLIFRDSRAKLVEWRQGRFPSFAIAAVTLRSMRARERTASAMTRCNA